MVFAPQPRCSKRSPYLPPQKRFSLALGVRRAWTSSFLSAPTLQRESTPLRGDFSRHPYSISRTMWMLLVLFPSNHARFTVKSMTLEMVTHHPNGASISSFMVVF